jgi:hypothetical protein
VPSAATTAVDQRHHLGPDAGVLTDFEGEVGDKPVDWRAQDGSVEIELGPPTTRQPALEQARTHFDEARKAMQQGDWAKFGTAMEALEQQLMAPPTP